MKLLIMKVSLLLCLVFGANSSYGDSLFFVHNGPLEFGSPKIPNRFIIYYFNETTKKLEPVWRAGDDWEAREVRIYYSSDIIMLRQEPTKLFIIPMHNISYAFDSNVTSLNWISGVHFYKNQNEFGYLGIESLRKMYDTSSCLSHYTDYFLLDDGLKESDKATIDLNGDLRLAGEDIVSYYSLMKIPSHPYNMDISFDGPLVPDSIVRMKESDGWVMIANEPDFRAFISVPDRNGLTQKELLIYNRMTEIWNSIMLDGAETIPYLINDWLVARVADQSPETDYIARKGVASIYGNTIALIKPLENHKFDINLDLDGTILWIEGDSLYYRIKNEIHRAIIKNNIIENDELLISNRMIYSIGRAFRGSMGPEGK